MRPICNFPDSIRSRLRYVICDIDDTLTCDGRLPAIAYRALEDLSNAGMTVIPVTGRPAGWCDMIARFWPVAGVVGENGAFYFAYNHETRKMVRHYVRSASRRAADRARLHEIGKRIIKEVRGCALSADQAYRESDLAIDFCEDVTPLPSDKIQHISNIFAEEGATSKCSSIHVNGWFGNYDKLLMTRKLLADRFDANETQVIFVGDSPNDQPLFGFFKNSVGVANIARFADDLSQPPTWITNRPGGYGFVELAEMILHQPLEKQAT